MINLALPLLINEVKKETLHCENELRKIEGRSRIVTWDKMKRELKSKYLPNKYRQDIFFKTHILKQKESISDGANRTQWNHDGGSRFCSKKEFEEYS